MILDYIILSLFVILYISVIVVFFLSWKNLNYKLQKYFLIFGIYSLLINTIGSIIIHLNSLNIINSPIFIKIVSIIHYESFMTSIFTVCIAYIFSFILLHKGIQRITEVTARFALDTMNSKAFDIDNKLATNEITKDEASSLKKDLMLNVDFYSSIDGTSKFFFKMMIINTVLFTLNIIVSVLIKSFTVHSLDFNYITSVISSFTVLLIIAQVIVFVIIGIHVSSINNK